MKNGTIYFENKYINLDEVINKTIFYINNNFNLEPKLENFYDSFGFQIGNNINKLIEYRIINSTNFIFIISKFYYMSIKDVKII